MFAATALLLLLACVNVTNLLLGRGAARAREVAVRTALGASRGRIVRQLLTESFLVTLLGAIAGLVFAFAGVRALQTLGASKLPRLRVGAVRRARARLRVDRAARQRRDARASRPAIRLARTDLKTLMNESGRSTSGGRGTARLMGVMTVAEVALALMLVAGAGWLVQSFSRLRATDPGLRRRGTADRRRAAEPAKRARRPIRRSRGRGNLFDRLRALPGRDRRRIDGGVPAARAHSTARCSCSSRARRSIAARHARARACGS